MRTQYYEVKLEVSAELSAWLVEEALYRALDWAKSGLDCADVQVKRTGEDDPVAGDPDEQGSAAVSKAGS